MAPHDKGAHLGDEIHVGAALIVEAARRVHGTLREREVGGSVLVRELGHVLQTVEIVHVARLSSAVGEGAHAARAEFCLVLLDLRADGVDGLIPADTLEFAASALAGATHGVLQALTAIDAPHVRETLRADTVVAGVSHLAGSGAHHLTVAHVHVQKAVARAAAAADAREMLRLGNLHGGVGQRRVLLVTADRLRSASG